MPKRKPLLKNPNHKQNSSPSLKDLLEGMDKGSVIGLLNTFEGSSAWALFRAYAYMTQRRFEVESLDMVGKEMPGAAYASGYAKCAEDMAEAFMIGLKQTVLDISPVVEKDREEEKEPQTVYDAL